jgi:hypothetical protein
VYIGEFQNEQMHGRGEYRFPDGSLYQGQFSRDKIHGLGTRRSANGETQSGEWNNGEFARACAVPEYIPVQQPPPNQERPRAATNQVVPSAIPGVSPALPNPAGITPRGE